MTKPPILFASFAVSLIASAALAAAPPADDFGDRFTGKTLRFDYFHSGTKGEERISLDEVRLEGEWPGSRRRLVDELGLGSYLFEVVDAATDRAIFSRGFDGIFGEWQTTGEAAARTWRTFHESQRFPEPRGDVRLVLKRRTALDRLETIFAQPFRSTEQRVNRSPREPRGTVSAVFQNGDSATKLDLLVMGDGYTTGEQDKFHGDTRRLVAILFDTEPFRSRRMDFNVWSVHVAAAASGISDPRRGRWLDSPLGFRSNAFGIDRYALSNENRAIHDAAAAAPHDSLVVITNTSKHAGGGIYNLWANAPADSPTAAYVFVHELGHSLAGLADEYYSADVAYLPTQRPVEPISPNVTALADPAKLKWRELVSPGTPLPTPWNQAAYDRVMNDHQTKIRELEARAASTEEIQARYRDLKVAAGPLLAAEQFAGKIGAFEGASYQAHGLFRPELDCIMFSQNRGAFCRVCTQAIERAIRQHGE